MPPVIHVINGSPVTIDPQRRDQVDYLKRDTSAEQNNRLRQHLATTDRHILLIVNEN